MYKGGKNEKTFMTICMYTHTYAQDTYIFVEEGSCPLNWLLYINKYKLSAGKFGNAIKMLAYFTLFSIRKSMSRIYAKKASCLWAKI